MTIHRSKLHRPCSKAHDSSWEPGLLFGVGCI